MAAIDTFDANGKKAIISMNPRHFKILDYTIEGWTVPRIAEQLSMSRVQVSLVVNSPTFRHEYAIRRSIYEEQRNNEVIKEEDTVTQTLKDGAIEAAKKLVVHIDSPDDSISVRSCAEVLDRAGYHKKVDSAHNQTGPIIIVNTKDAALIVETIEMDNLSVVDNSCERADVLSEGNDSPLSTLDQHGQPVLNSAD